MTQSTGITYANSQPPPPPLSFVLQKEANRRTVTSGILLSEATVRAQERVFEEPSYLFKGG